MVGNDPTRPAGHSLSCHDPREGGVASRSRISPGPLLKRRLRGEARIAPRGLRHRRESKDMSQNGKSSLTEILARHEADLLSDWVGEQVAGVGQRRSVKEVEIRDQCRE